MLQLLVLLIMYQRSQIYEATDTHTRTYTKTNIHFVLSETVGDTKNRLQFFALTNFNCLLLHSMDWASCMLYLVV